MPTYRLDLPPPHAPPAARWRRFASPRMGAAVAIAIVAIGVAAAAQAYRRDPARVGEAFLAACRAGETARLEGLLDDSYGKVFPAGAGRDLLAALHRNQTPAYRIEEGGRPAVAGGHSDARRYALRVVAEERRSSSDGVPSVFVVTLVQSPDARWRVGFVATYHSLMTHLYGAAGEREFDRLVTAHARGQAARLLDWDAIMLGRHRAVD